VKILEVVGLMLKVRLLSWITMSSQGAVITNSGVTIIIASYKNGRRIKRAEDLPVPDLIPPGWGPDGPLPETTE
jgi:hypothetical protein